jgi:ribonuclease Z
VVNGTPYIVDAGPGIVRRAAAAFNKGVKGLAVERLQTAFITHLHVDHTVGYPDLIFTPWVSGRNTPLRMYGPTGLEAMTKAILLAWQADTTFKRKGWNSAALPGSPSTCTKSSRVRSTKTRNVKVFAFPVHHGDWPEAFGYRFQTPDRTVVISGDTTPSPGVIDNCQKCDVLIHEAYSEEYLPPAVPNWREYR